MYPDSYVAKTTDAHRWTRINQGEHESAVTFLCSIISVHLWFLSACRINHPRKIRLVEGCIGRDYLA